MKDPLTVMRTFTLDSIPNLDVCVLAALKLFSKTKLPALTIPYQKPLVVGSGNAAATGRILFEDVDAVFADESTFETKLKHISSIDGVVLISASGGKHAPLIAKCSKHYKKHVTLITNNPHALTKEYLDNKHKYDCYLFPKNREPYTYNTSTYLGPIIGKTGENPRAILLFIKEKIDTIPLPDFSKYRRYYLLVPEEFEGTIRLLNVKFIELFGRNIARDIETFEYAKHATTLVPAEDELFISFGKNNTLWGKHTLFIPLPKNAGYGAMMAISYYLVGKIQKAQPPWFKENLTSYTLKASTVFGQTISPIVE